MMYEFRKPVGLGSANVFIEDGETTVFVLPNSSILSNMEELLHFCIEFPKFVVDCQNYVKKDLLQKQQAPESGTVQ